MIQELVIQTPIIELYLLKIIIIVLEYTESTVTMVTIIQLSIISVTETSLYTKDF